MANQPRSGGSKDKDDDSWGKLASDLFGIQFGGPSDDDDFDLTEDEPAKPATPAPAAVTPLAATTEEEPDLSFPEDDDTPAPPVRRAAAAPAPERRPAAPAPVVAEEVPAAEVLEDRADKRDDNEKDIWDLLESWNWDEPNREASRVKAPEGDTRGNGRSSGGRQDRGPRGDRPRSGRDRDRGRDADRPPRTRDAEPAPAPAAASAEPTESRPPRREERPRADRPPRERTESRPPRSEDRGERRPRRSDRPAPAAPAKAADEFSSGIDDAPVARPAAERPERTERVERARPPAQSRRRPARTPRPPAENVDEFVGDLFEETDEVEDVEEATITGEADAPAGDEEPRRRRRRRRRGGRSRREEGAVEGRETEGAAEAGTDDEESTDDEVETVATGEPSEATEGEEGQPRRRRRRRVRRRRPDEAAPRSEVLEAGEPADVIDDEEVTAEAGFAEDEEDEEIVVPVSYEGIPSWEEAISYLQRRPRDSRPRTEQPGRGRGGNHRR